MHTLRWQYTFIPEGREIKGTKLAFWQRVSVYLFALRPRMLDARTSIAISSGDNQLTRLAIRLLIS